MGSRLSSGRIGRGVKMVVGALFGCGRQVEFEVRTTGGRAVRCLSETFSRVDAMEVENEVGWFGEMRNKRLRAPKAVRGMMRGRDICGVSNPSGASLRNMWLI